MSLKHKRIITNSEIQLFKTCRLAWKYQYVDHLFPKEPSMKLFLGSLIHTSLAEYYNCIKEFKEKLPISGCEQTGLITFENEYNKRLEYIKKSLKIDEFDEEVMQEYEKTYKLGKGMLLGYFDYAQTYDSFEVIKVENPIFIDIYTEKGYKSRILFRATPDMIIKDNIGYWVMEHKTAISTNTDVYEIDEQATSYVLATQNYLNNYLGGKTDVKGVIYNILRKKLPKEPQLLKSGKLSTNKRIDTTYDKYFETIEKYNLNPVDYAEILDILANKGNTFFHREKFYRNQEEVKNQNYRIYRVGKDMYSGKCADIYYRPSRDCGWKCAYKDLCLASQDGSDVNYLIDSLFRKILGGGL